MALGRLTFDTTDANTIADSHHVGAHTLSGTGSLITSGDGDSDNLVNTAIEGLDVRSFLFGYDSIGDNWDRVQQVAGALKVYIDDGDFEVEVTINAERAEDSAHTSGDIGNFVLAVRDDGAPATALAEGATFTADVPGTGGNSISLIFDGTDDVDTVVGAWNTANPSNTVSFTGVAGTTVLSDQTVNLAGGAARTSWTSDNYDYSPIAVDEFGVVQVSDRDVLSQLQSGVTVTATDLDIRDLTAASDSVASWTNDGAGNAIGSTSGALDVFLTNTNIEVTQGTSPWVIGDGGGSITVDAVDLDIRDLTHVSDSVSLGDGTNLYTSTTIGSDIGLDVNVINDPSVAAAAIANAANTLGAASTAEDAVASPLANRKYLFVYNNDNQRMFIGATGVTEANGFPISPKSYMELRAGSAVDVEWVSSKVAHEIRTLELA